MLKAKLREFRKIIVDKRIVPTKVIDNRRIKNIKSLTEDFVINSYTIILSDDLKIKNVFLDCRHPNANPETNEFCFPDNIYEEVVEVENLDEICNKIEYFLRIFNYDDCYFRPWLEVIFENEDYK